MPVSRRNYFYAVLLIAAAAELSLRAGRNTTAFTPYTTPPLPRHASGDFDGDGRPDVARIEDAGTRQISVSLSGTASVLNLAAEVAVLIDKDIDEDGDLDLVATTSDNEVLIWLNDGHGRFTREEPSRHRGWSGEASMTDADASAQLAVGPGAQVVEWARGRTERLSARRIRPPTIAVEFQPQPLHTPGLRAPPAASI
jgi:hypothetical protein